MIKRLFFVILSFVLISINLFSVSGLDYKCPVEPRSDSVYLVNMDTGTVVYEKNADKRNFPASTTKIMTYIIAIENIQDIDHTMVEIKESVIKELADTDSSVAGLENHIGKKLSVKDLLYCLMVASGNDASLVLADYVGKGSIESFVKKMNEKAAELGCKNTNFTNPHGLHNDNHYTTAKDLYIIANYALTLPNFAEISNTVTYLIKGDDYPLTTTNYMIDPSRESDYYYLYCRGIKTGYTDEAGRCLVSTAIADGYAYMCITLHAPGGSEDSIGSMLDSREFYRWALTNIEIKYLISKQTPICEQNINFGKGIESIRLVPQNNVNHLMPKDMEEADITWKAHTMDSIDAPVKEGDILGTADVFYKGEKIKEINLVAEQDVERSPVLFALHMIKSIVFSIWFLVSMAIIIILCFIYFFITAKYNLDRDYQKKVKKYRNL